MKKLLPFLVLFVCFTTLAQTVTQESLQGKWKLVHSDINGIAFDFVTKKCTLPEDMERGKTPEQIAAKKSSISTKLGALDISIEFGEVSLMIKTIHKEEIEIEQGSYKILPGLPVIVETLLEGETTPLEAWFEDSKLVLKDNKSNSKFMYVKS